MSTCMLFVFAALLEYAVVQFLSRQTDGKLYQQKCEEMRLLKLPGGAQQMDNEDRFHENFSSAWNLFRDKSCLENHQKLRRMRQNMKRTWLGFIVEFLEEHFFLNEFFDPGENSCGQNFEIGWSLSF